MSILASPCKSPKCRLQQLPSELLIRIFLFGQNPAFVSTCKSIYTISRSPLIRAQFILRRYGPLAALSERCLTSLPIARQLPVVDYLLKLRADPRADADYLLWQSIREQNVNLTILLVDAIQPDTRTLQQYLNGAASHGSISMVDLLVARYGASIDHGDGTVMMLACAENRVELVRHLLTRYHCDPHAFRDQYLRRACLSGHEALVELLLPGADVHAFNDAALQNAVHKNHLGIAYQLLAQGASANVNRGACVILAVQQHHVPILRLLLDHGADPRCQQDSPLQLSCRMGLLDVAQVLVEFASERLAMINTLKGMPLYEAFRHGHADVVDFLLSGGADPSLPLAQQGLHEAILHNHVACVAQLQRAHTELPLPRPLAQYKASASGPMFQLIQHWAS
ncbi:ankyrin [Hesseltinella vesiculosa]|uniref:Ankyrin n=1 Tax=Hesseltinella vesiculosa TaxID=101127 RepID=A0A1X2G5A1_9FUNG|nr:ankyrin [Hesseltinella vesiculosa]